jgi:hypothetical protein
MKKTLALFALVLVPLFSQASQVGSSVEGVVLSAQAAVTFEETRNQCSETVVLATRDKVLSMLKFGGQQVPENVAVSDLIHFGNGAFGIVVDLSEIPDAVPELTFEAKAERQGDSCVITYGPERVVNGGFSVHN